VRSRTFAAAAHQQSLAVANSPQANEDQDFRRCDFWLGYGMKHGEVWTAAGGPDYTGKPRPVVLLCQMKNAGMRNQFRLGHSVDGYCIAVSI
jgi:hypothetical protein